jgi:heme/copper-type cytochrome/quinol oxidase subunit 2
MRKGDKELDEIILPLMTGISIFLIFILATIAIFFTKKKLDLKNSLHRSLFLFFIFIAISEVYTIGLTFLSSAIAQNFAMKGTEHLRIGLLLSGLQFIGFSIKEIGFIILLKGIYKGDNCNG